MILNKQSLKLLEAILDFYCEVKITENTKLFGDFILNHADI